MQQRFVLVILTITAGVLAACASAGSEQTPEATPTEEPTIEPTTEPGASELAGSSWVLTSIPGATLPEGIEITLIFEEANLSGTVCNNYGGSYTAEAGTLTVGNLISTDMACIEPEGIMDMEAAYTGLLGAATGYEISGDQLIISTADNPTALLFERAEAAPDEADSLAGSAWLLSEINGAPPIAGTQFTLLFEADRLNGQACNQYSAGYTLGEAGAIVIEPVIMTKMACTEPEGIMAQEAAYGEALQIAITYQLDDDTLRLIGEDGTTTLVFTRDNDASVSSTNLAGTEWVLVSLNGSSPLDGVEVTLTFDDQRIGGNSGCNSYGGDYTVGEGNSFIVPEIEMTLMACMEPAGAMDQEAAYHEALRSITSFELDGDQLSLYGETSTLIFVRKSS